MLKRLKGFPVEKLISELDKEEDLWQHKFGKVTIDQKYKSYYIMGVVGGLRLALRAIERLR